MRAFFHKSLITIKIWRRRKTTLVWHVRIDRRMWKQKNCITKSIFCLKCLFLLPLLDFTINKKQNQYTVYSTTGQINCSLASNGKHPASKYILMMRYVCKTRELVFSSWWCCALTRSYVMLQKEVHWGKEELPCCSLVVVVIAAYIFALIFLLS